MSESEPRTIRLPRLHRSFKRIIVSILIIIGLAGEALPEEYAKLVTVPALLGATIIEVSIKGE